ncbi:hypothetical protein ES703_62131 [subsurface metagenome]
MRVLLDTNIVLDVLLKREPWVSNSKSIWQANDDGRITGYIAGTTLTDIFYIARKITDFSTAQEAVKTCLEAFEICTVDHRALELAVTFQGNDFEDNLQIACANIESLDAIVTRDPEGFKNSPVLILTPEKILKKIIK